ncbi:phosphatidate cytidylyltransferase [Propionibacterium freudenreichii]|uniref:phosphatidate cytidylyltransferase n=1 Tax=Propionibacterium freudenreichii TaxID=1744 RepID=UPI000543B1E3|nr:phosphatidate cytidylyltransferase [Propionibacterium freudenreichii]MCT2997828.1 phosphatidate cytidylyltransferase [Propionibacterium freudenreichii]MCT3003017.1 phosphatidate cytidylyltransferase [Propionibacterium freudenreichii]MDK9625816.1 phosphatidate cytidylyltransferase [Propionibacterium freudenreichii]MDK9656543.1 phosphatidate cytidylyltransferase [Propionibacterium freudenreichii]MDK9670478.1 phosphatidate cytidylyltransferase [Propionibacterium freudenreichii]
MSAAKRSPGRNLPAAITTGVILGAVVVATLLWWNWGFALFVALALALGVWEVCNALEKLDMHPARWPILVGTPIVMIGSYAVGQGSGEPESALGFIVGGLALMVIVALFWRIPRGTQDFVRDAAASLFVIGYLPLLGSTVALMLAGSSGVARIFCFLLAPIASDTGAYVVGVLFGKHKMAPRISPAKSWEGFAGGIVTAMVLCALAVHGLLHAPAWVGLVLGLVAGCCGVVGDLVESAIKRDAGIKDMSHVLPGHGGVMDRLDSLLAAAPAAWLVMYVLIV